MLSLVTSAVGASSPVLLMVFGFVGFFGDAANLAVLFDANLALGALELLGAVAAGFTFADLWRRRG